MSARPTLPPRPDAPAPEFVESFDGARIAYRVVGEGRPLLLLHGIMSDGAWAWFGPGHAARLAARGRRVIVPDLRGHGASAAPRGPEAFANDALLRDVEAVLAHCAAAEHDVAGYSLGARLALRQLIRGAHPAHAVLGGVGDALVLGSPLLGKERFDRLIATEGRSGVAGDAETWAWMRYGGFDPQVMRSLVAGLAPITVDQLAKVLVPITLAIGSSDDTVGSAGRLAGLLPRATLRVIGGDHVQAGLSSQWGDVLVERLG